MTKANKNTKGTTAVLETKKGIDLTKPVQVKVDVKPVAPEGAPKVNISKGVEVAVKQPTKSELIRSMYQEGISVADIARQTDSHYSFVYGVVKNLLKGEKPVSQKGPSKSDEIRRLSDEGKTPGEIAKELNANYSFVHTVVKKHKATKEDK